MALAPKFAGQRFLAATKTSISSNPTPALHTIEIYLDYVCPYSAKLFNTLYHTVFPILENKYASKVQVLFRQQIQPWHPSSTLTHEAAAAVLKLKPENFWEFSDALFKDSKSYYDVNVVNETRNQTYIRLAKLAASSISVSESEIFDLLKISGKPAEDGSLNIGNGVTNDIKVLVKVNRMQGVHVTPTVVFNGVVENSISSGWTGEQWEEWLEKNIVWLDEESMGSSKLAVGSHEFRGKL